ncbi:MAG: 30S ribosomal protein S8 [Candidatus Aenigmarchaeota archaeon]|nr:30S ribosomal protein S8 [Candidatus Aenigmarchaeota archaeon]
MKQDLLADVLFVLNTAEQTGKKTCIVPSSRLIKNVLLVVQKEGYIGRFEFIDDGKGGKFEVELIGRINKSRTIKPRFAVKKNEYEKWEKRFLPARDFGILIVSTPKGVMSQKDAASSELGGKLVAYLY